VARGWTEDSLNLVKKALGERGGGASGNEKDGVKKTSRPHEENSLQRWGAGGTVLPRKKGKKWGFGKNPRLGRRGLRPESANSCYGHAGKMGGEHTLEEKMGGNPTSNI